MEKNTKATFEMRELEVICKISQDFTRDFEVLNYNRINADQFIFSKIRDKALITFKGVSGQVFKWYVVLMKGELTILHGDSPTELKHIYKTKIADKYSRIFLKTV